jgi:hypothetical protein
MKTSRLGEFIFEFDYNQFLVYDSSVEVPKCEWTEAHTLQGFARRKSVACVGTLLPGGQAEATVFLGSYKAQLDYERVIALPFHSPTGKIIVRGLVVKKCILRMSFSGDQGTTDCTQHSGSLTKMTIVKAFISSLSGTKLPCLGARS